MSAEKIATYSGFWRILIFVFALLLHVATICFFSIQQKEEAVETIDFRETEVFKLVDVQEYIKPLVQEKTSVVVNQPKASEHIQETEKTIVEVTETNPPAAKEFDESEFLPQHKISSVPVIPIREVLSKIEYPPMALRQGI